MTDGMVSDAEDIVTIVSRISQQAGQRALPLPQPVLPQEDADGNYGEVFTRRWVVDLILDLVGYRDTQDLAMKRIVDPACGDGAFLTPIAERIITSCRALGRPLADAWDAVRAFDLQRRHVDTSRRMLSEMLTSAGMTEVDASAMAEAWVRHGDFLLEPHDEETADIVVGNPPYIRPESIPDEKMAIYRHSLSTMSGRADIYIGFFEVSLRLLTKGGVLGFICADRWMRNAYGKKLRQLISQGFSVEAAIEMHDVDAFANKVSAYPAITVIRRAEQGQPFVVTTTVDFDSDAAKEAMEWANAHPVPGESTTIIAGTRIARLPGWFNGGSHWPTGSPERLSLLRDLENRFSVIETGSTRVGIGVATGADKVFITKNEGIVERDRLIPLVMTGDTTTGFLEWGGTYLVNPWEAPRRLVELADYPRLADYFQEHAHLLRNRHVACKRPTQWYRTIDPVHPELIAKPKLLFPDMKMTSHPVLDPGGYYPHHNLYYIISDDWDLEALGGLLMSRVAQFFIESYAVRMRGGTLRFQAQYLRRIRVPDLSSLSEQILAGLRSAFRHRDAEMATALALDAYQIAGLPD